MKTRYVAAALVLLAVASASDAQQGIRILIPADNTCDAFLAALNSSDRAAMLDLGGWALGYLSGVAQQSGKDILRQVSSQGIMDRIADSCQRQPQRPMFTVVMDVANSLFANTR